MLTGVCVRPVVAVIIPMTSIYFYVPNLIGYARVVLALFGYYYALIDYRVTVTVYLVSQLLDAADGFAARLLKQSSTFGAVLDMVTDRASTTCLCIVLGRLYPDWIIGFTSLVMLDMGSHWYHMYASLLLGSSSHKEVESPFLRLYYWKVRTHSNSTRHAPASSVARAPCRSHSRCSLWHVRERSSGMSRCTRWLSQAGPR